MDVLRDNEDYLDDESDSDDADFVPGEAPDSDVSEEDVNDKATEGKPRAGSKGKRKKIQKGKGKKLKRNNDDSDDDLDDEDFSVNLHSTGVEEEQTKEVDEEAEKKRTDRLWSDFLSGVEEMSKKKKPDPNSQGIITKKVYDFAGEKVVVEEKVSGPMCNGSSTIDSSNSSSSISTNISPGESKVAVTSTTTEDKTSSTTPSASTGFPVRKGRISFLSGSPAQIGLVAKPGAKKAGGLSAVLSAIQSNKKQKMGTLEKSRLDWQAFKKDEGIDEELKTHVKSKDGYVDRQEFLHRADVRQFEIEKNLRTRQRRNP